jgi:hypothetical protein
MPSLWGNIQYVHASSTFVFTPFYVYTRRAYRGGHRSIIFVCDHSTMSVPSSAHFYGKLDRIFRGGILSVPGIPIFLSGCDNRVVTMETIEFGEWAKTTGEPFPAQTWETLGSQLIADSFKGTFRQEKSKIPLPDALRNSQRERSWTSGGWASRAGSSQPEPSLKKV